MTSQRRPHAALPAPEFGSGALGLGSDGADERSSGRVDVTRFLYWLPVAAPLVLLAQVALLGLRPALAETRHLARQREALAERWNADVALAHDLELSLSARADPIFRARRERLRRIASHPWPGR